MLTIRLKFNCRLCGKEKFYLMPLDNKTPGGDIVQSKDKFRAKCKACGKNYIIRLNVEVDS